jgi:hypothetical protein
MAIYDQMLRKEQDPFHKPESQLESEREQAAAEAHRRAEAEQQKLSEQARSLSEKLAPSLTAELPKQTAASQEAVKRLFGHFSERSRKLDPTRDERLRASSTQTDPRTTSQARDPRGKARPQLEDEFKDGIAADFLRDSKISAADMDEGPHGSDATSFDAWEGGSRRKRRRGAAATKSRKREGKP